MGSCLLRKRHCWRWPRPLRALEDFVTHAGRILALCLPGYILAQAGVDLRRVPVHDATADTHEGVKTSAHEIFEFHRSNWEKKLLEAFHEALNEALVQRGITGDPADEAAARDLALALFRWRNIIPQNQYQDLIGEHGSFPQHSGGFLLDPLEGLKPFFKNVGRNILKSGEESRSGQLPEHL